MTHAFDCLLFSNDPELVRRIQGLLSSLITVRVSETPPRIEQLSGPGVWLIDVRLEGLRDRLPELARSPDHPLIIALAEPGSDPAREALALGLYGVEDLIPDRIRFQQLMTRAMEHARLEQELKILREERLRLPRPAVDPVANAATPKSFPLHPFTQALKNLSNVAALFDGVTEGIAHAVMTSRVGLFTECREDETYCLRAERNCLDETHALRFDVHHPLVSCLARRAHPICRSSLDCLDQPPERLLFSQALDGMGAEVMIPLFARGRLRGWFFVGKRSTGQPYGPADLQALAELADHVSTTIENALLYEEVTLQKSLGETLLDSIPTGIVAVGDGGTLRWFNRAAEDMLGATAKDVLGQPAERAGSILAGLLRRALAGEAPAAAQEWKDLRTGRHLSAVIRRLTDGAQCLGAVAMVENVTTQRQLKEKQDQVERSAFWTDLAAALSHEIRNPLVAIKTFAQLLPSRHEDPEFRDEFSRQVTFEAERLNALIEQMDQFAHPPEPKVALVDFGAVIRQAMDLAAARHPSSPAQVEASIGGALPPVRGDARALSEAIAHLIVNALEALAGRAHAHLHISAQPYEDPGDQHGVRIDVQDDGPGIPAAIRDKIFSPFCTTKARGLGLGLPIVKRTAIDHGGRVEMRTGQGGTLFALYLPAAAAML